MCYLCRRNQQDGIVDTRYDITVVKGEIMYCNEVRFGKYTTCRFSIYIITDRAPAQICYCVRSSQLSRDNI